MKLRPSPVKRTAAAAGVPVWQPNRAVEILPALRDAAVDACAVVAYGSILPPDVLAAGGAGFVNLHFSLLPAWRGAAPVPAAIRAGDAATGVTCFVLEAGMDTGPVISTWRTAIGRAETAGELTARLAVAGAPLLVDAVVALAGGDAAPRPQDHDAASYAPKIASENAAIRWRWTADEVDRTVRAYNPVPGAHTSMASRRLKLHRVTPVPPTGAADGPTPAAVGTVLRDGGGHPIVVCGRGAVRLDEVQPAGKSRMDGLAFLNGYRPARLGSA